MHNYSFIYTQSNKRMKCTFPSVTIMYKMDKKAAASFFIKVVLNLNENKEIKRSHLTSKRVFKPLSVSGCLYVFYSQSMFGFFVLFYWIKQIR